VDWDGSDGLSWIRHERDVLSELATTHVAVPSVYEYFEQGGNGYLVLEWIEGRSVAELVGGDAPLLEVPVALELGRACAEAVAGLHEAGWSWRDLKPQNLIVAEDGIRLVDFEGAARVGDSVGAPWGTAGYLPPEWLESKEISTAQDCYGLGVVLSQLFTNAPVTPGADIAPIGSEREGVPPVVNHLVASLTDPNPARRPSAAQVAKALSA
jgi:serine/threonine protein kinase